MDFQHKNRMCIVAYSSYRSILSRSLKVRNSIELLVLYHNCAVFLSTPKEWGDFCYTMLVEMLDPESRSLCACADRPIVLGIGTEWRHRHVCGAAPALRRARATSCHEYTYTSRRTYVSRFKSCSQAFFSLLQSSPCHAEVMLKWCYDLDVSRLKGCDALWKTVKGGRLIRPLPLFVYTHSDSAKFLSWSIPQWSHERLARL